MSDTESPSVPLYRVSRFGFSAEVFPRAVRYRSGLWLPKTTEIRASQIASVTKEQRPGYVTITTTDGWTHRLLIGVQAGEFVEAVSRILA
jgi:hypothetical protein